MGGIKDMGFDQVKNTSKGWVLSHGGLSILSGFFFLTLRPMEYYYGILKGCHT